MVFVQSLSRIMSLLIPLICVTSLVADDSSSANRITTTEVRQRIEHNAADLIHTEEGEFSDDESDDLGFGWSLWTFFYYGWGRYLYLAFFVWMLISSLRNDPDRGIWFWVILVFQPFGAFLYFVIRWLPQLTVTPPAFLRRWTSGNEIRQLEIAAQRIGNAHQFIELGNLLNEVGRCDEAQAAFGRAIEKEPDSLPALWGGAFADHATGDVAAAKEKLKQVMEIDRTYKFGDASLLYAKCLVALDETVAAREQLETHTRKWRHPEALYLLAVSQQLAGDDALARQSLEGIIADLETVPAAIAKKSLHWKSKAKKLLKQLRN
ncbi:MAG: tetratricopeptide repeat protein [Planctomycetaceae bacterium]